MIKTIKNAESNESTLRMLYSHKVDNSDKVKVEKKKSFPFLTFGNNKESPDYFRLPNIGVNKFTVKNRYKINCPSSIKVDDNLINTVNKFTTKNRESLSKNLVISNDYYTDSNFFRDNLNYNGPQTVKNSSSQKTNIFKQDLIKPFLTTNQTSYLKNINDYDIKENYARNEERFLKYDYKKKSDYDILKNSKNNYKSIEYTLERWPQFYESYYTLKSTDNGFNKKIGLFSNYAHCNMLPTSKVGEVVEKYNKNSIKDSDEKQKYLNFSGEHKINSKMKSRFSKYDNLSKQRVFSTDFEMKFNKGN